MKKRLLLFFAVLGLLVCGATAADSITKVKNADGTETTTFDFLTGAWSDLQLESKVICKAFSTRNNVLWEMHRCTNEGMTMFAFNDVTSTNRTWLRHEGDKYNYLKAYGAPFPFTILGLKAGDKVTVTFKWEGDGASSAYMGKTDTDGTWSCVDKDGAAVDLAGANINSAGAFTFTMLTDGNFSMCMGKNSEVSSIAITVTPLAAAVPDGKITGVDGTNRTITLTTETQDATIRYTTDGSEPTATTGEEYKEPFSISATTTVKAVTVTSEATSEVFEKEFVAGEEVKLNGVSMEQWADGVHFSTNQGNILLAPTATINYSIGETQATAQNGGVVDNLGTTGIVTAYASAAGYANSDNATLTLSPPVEYTINRTINLTMADLGLTEETSLTVGDALEGTNGNDALLNGESLGIYIQDAGKFIVKAGGLYHNASGGRNIILTGLIADQYIVLTYNKSCTAGANTSLVTLNSTPYVKYAFKVSSNGNATISLERYGTLAKIEITKSTSAGIAAPAATKRTDGAAYDLQGRRVLNPGKGLYIQDGKLKMVK